MGHPRRRYPNRNPVKEQVTVRYKPNALTIRYGRFAAHPLTDLNKHTPRHARCNPSKVGTTHCNSTCTFEMKIFKQQGQRAGNCVET